MAVNSKAVEAHRSRTWRRRLYYWFGLLLFGVAMFFAGNEWGKSEIPSTDDALRAAAQRFDLNLTPFDIEREQIAHDILQAWYMRSREDTIEIGSWTIAVHKETPDGRPGEVLASTSWMVTGSRGGGERRRVLLVAEPRTPAARCRWLVSGGRAK